ncbi:MAG: glycoside hydrolase [Gemmatimonadetes bacterium]|nr:glycoside hydrolase [Gemmatimonadota bacterium]
MILRRSSASAVAVAALGLTAASCTRDAPDPVALALGEIELTGPVESQTPNFAYGGEGRAVLTWLEGASGGTASLKLATRDADGWSEPVTVHTSDRLFVNWADFPSAVRMADGTLAAHWLERVADAPYAYHVMLSLSSDGGRTWTEPMRAHDDDSPTEHGFVSMVPWDDGAAMVWLDGRAMYVPETYDGEGSASSEGGIRGSMSARFRTLTADGVLGPEVLLDDRTCECCQTGLARVGDGLVAAYRDRSREEVRDIAVVRGSGENWSAPTHVSTDGWTIGGCPVNGPQLSAEGPAVAAAWFTGAGDMHQVYVAFSEDGGATFGDRIRVDEGGPIGRVDIERLDDGSAVVVWLEASGDRSRVLARRVTPTGETGPTLVVSETSSERASGFPRMTRVHDELLLAWTLPTEDGGVRVRSIKPAD